MKLAPAPDFPGSKEEFNVWKQLPSTQHCFFNCCEGVTPSARVTQENNPKMLWGLVFEFDSDIDDAMVALIPVNGVAGLLPTWVLRSRFRNGRRLVWEFAEPIFIDHADLADRFIKLFVKEAKVENILPGLDKTGLKLTQYQELGKDWTKVAGSSPVATNLLSMLFFKAAAQKGLKSDGPDIPIEAVAAEVEARWPGRWPGEFAVGVRGPLFWVDPFLDRVGAVVGDHGMICFSDRAGAAFKHWGEILGQDFVRNFYAAQIGQAVKDIFFDSNVYWSKLDNGIWATNKKEDLGDDLQHQYSLKPAQVKGALSIIRNTHRITAAFPFVHNKEVVITTNTGTFLNTNQRKLIKPADIDGPSPWLDKFFGNCWDPNYKQIQYDSFMAWFQRFYLSALEGRLESGHAIMIGGPTSTGKTLLNYHIVGNAVGGHADAANFILGKTIFNRECAESAYWAVDDDRGSSTWERRDEFSNCLKRLVANTRMAYHAKYKDEQTVDWRGRIGVTFNLDPKGLQILPDMDSSNEDKIMLFQFGDYLPDFTNVEEVIARELPFYLRKVVNWKIPDYIMGAPRFGVKSFHHPNLMQASRDAAPSGILAEMLPFAIARGVINDTHETQRWMNATEIRAILDIEGLRSGLSKFLGNRLGIALSELGPPLILETKRHKTKGKLYLLNLVGG